MTGKIFDTPAAAPELAPSVTRDEAGDRTGAAFDAAAFEGVAA